MFPEIICKLQSFTLNCTDHINEQLTSNPFNKKTTTKTRIEGSFFLSIVLFRTFALYKNMQKNLVYQTNSKAVRSIVAHLEQ